MSRSILLTAAALSTVSLCVADVLAADRHVPSQYSTIQTAINAAANGDQVIVAPGTYAEAINLNGKNITVRSTQGPGETIIDASGVNWALQEGSVISITDGQWAQAVVDGFTVTGGRGQKIGSVRHGGGLFVRFSNPTIRNCVFSGNRAGAGGGVAILGSFGSLENCRMEGNIADYGSNYGGGGLFLQTGQPRIINCVIEQNATAGSATGGGVATLNSWGELTNCLIVDNAALSGGAIRHTNGELKLTNCTLAGNAATSGGGALHSATSQSVTDFSNCIIWNNSSPQAELMLTNGAAANVAHSTVPGGWPGEGNIDSDPMFNGAESGAYDVLPGSPCVDAGDDAALPEDVTTDLAGNERFFGEAVDMGAFETQYLLADNCPGDIRPSGGDGNVSVTDVLAVVFAYSLPCEGCPEDISPVMGDGSVNIDDVVAVISNLGPCPN